MADQLDDFINENRKDFDTEVPSTHVWDQIRDGLDDGKAQTSAAWYWKAAAVVLLILSSYLIIDRLRNPGLQPELITQTEMQDEFVLAEDYYFSLINEKITEIQNSEMDPELKEDFSSEVKKLDETYLELQSEYSHVKDEKVKNAMIMNLQVRIDLLNEQLKIIKNVKTFEKNENESI